MYHISEMLLFKGTDEAHVLSVKSSIFSPTCKFLGSHFLHPHSPSDKSRQIIKGTPPRKGWKGHVWGYGGSIGERGTTVQHSCPGNGRLSSFCSRKRTHLAGPGSGCRPGSSRCTWLWGRRKSQVYLRMKPEGCRRWPMCRSLSVWLCQVHST